MDKKALHIYVPHWLVWAYALLAAILLPWTIYLSITLPTRHLSHHWDVSWVGLDIAIFVTLLATAALCHWRSKWVVMTATAAGSLMLVDAWFDVLSERPGPRLWAAIGMALFIELPLAVTSYTIACRAIKAAQG